MTTAPLPIILVTGALGSGKTGLINRVLATPAYADSAVIIGERGASAVTHGVVAAARGRAPLAGVGCPCCAPPGALAEALRRLFLDQARGTGAEVSRVLVETAGDADPRHLTAAIMADRLVSARFRMAGVVAVVDRHEGMAWLDRAPAAPAQIAAADRILLLGGLERGAAPDRLAERLAALNPAARRHDIAADGFAAALLADGW